MEGHSTPGGYSSKAVKPIALAKCMNVAKVIEEEFGGLKGGRSLSGIGGVERGSDAAEFILLGASTVQVQFQAISCHMHVRLAYSSVQIIGIQSAALVTSCDLFVCISPPILSCVLHKSYFRQQMKAITGTQVCTGVMLHGYPLVKHLCGGLQEFMKQHNFESIEDFRGASLPYFTTHKALYDMQQAAIAKKKARKGLKDDAEWTGDGFVRETETMVSN